MAADDLLETLLLRYLDQTASADEHAEVERRLRSDAGARDRFVMLALAQAHLPRIVRTARVRRRGMLVGLAAAAVTVALLGAHGVHAWLANRPVPASTLATTAPLLRTAGAVTVRGAGGDGRVTGQVALGPGDAIALDQGDAADVTWADGTAIRLSAGSLARWRGDAPGKRFELAAGTADLDVAKQPRGAPLIVTTPTASVTVVGTSLRIDAGALATAVMVTAGTVDVERLTDQARVRLDAGQRCPVVPDQPLAREDAGTATLMIDELAHDQQRWFALAGGGARAAIAAVPGPFVATAAALTVDTAGVVQPPKPDDWPWSAFTIGLAAPGDWSQARAIGFWFRGTGDGGEVRVELNGAIPPGGDLSGCPRYVTVIADSSPRWRHIQLPLAGFAPRLDSPVPSPPSWDRKAVNAVSLIITPARAGTWAWARIELIR